MTNSNTTKNQLLVEIEELKKQIVELKTSVQQQELFEVPREEYLNAFFNHSPVGMAIWDREFRYLHINNVLQEINGPSLEDHIGKTVQQVLPGVAHLIIPLFQKILDTCEPIQNMELSGEAPAKPGETGHFLVSYFPISIVNGTPQFIGGTIVDISEQKLAEETILQNKNRLEYALNSIETGAWELDLIKKDSWRSFEHDKIFGYPKPLSKWTYDMFLEHLHPEDREMVDAKFQKAILTHSNWNFECRINRKDGRVRWILGKGSYELNKNEDPTKMFGIVQDITEKKLAEDSLRESEEKFNAFTSQSVDGISVADEDGKYDYVNPAFCKMVGFTEAELLKMTVFDVTSDSQDKTTFKNTRGTREGEPVQVVLKRKNGEDFAAEVVGNNIKVGEQRRVLGIIRDISERKQAEKALQISEERYNLAMSATKDGLYDWDLVTNEIYYSPGWKKMLGYAPNELADDFSVWETHTDKKDVEASWNMQKELISGSLDRFELEFKMKHKKGHWVDILSRAEAIFDVSGKAVRIVGIHTDISQRKQLENLHKQNELRLRQSMSAAKAGSWVWEMKSNELIWDNRMAEIFGYGPGEFDGTIASWRQKVHPEDVERADRLTSKAGSTGESYNFEYRLNIKTGKGAWRTVQSHGIVIKDEHEVPIRMVGFCRDVSERISVETALKESEEKFRALFEQAGGYCMILDPNTSDGIPVILEANNAALEIHGYSRDEFIGLPITNLDDEQGAKLVQERTNIIMGGDPFYVENTHMRKDGSTFEVAVNAQRIDFGNLPPLIFTTEYDISDRKKIENSLKESEALLSESQKIARIGSFVVDITQGVWKSSSMLDEIFGIDQSFIKGMPNLMKQVHPEDQEMMKNHFEVDVLTNHESFDKEYRILSGKDEQEKWVHGIGKLELGGNGQPVKIIGTIQDITDKKLSEEKRFALEAQLNQSQKIEAIGTMVGGISHELNNVLQSMFLYLDMLAESIPESDVRYPSMLRLLEGGERARDIVSQVLTFSRNSEVDMKPQPLQALLKESLSLERASLPANIELVQTIDPGCGLVLCDKTQIHQIVINLCNNAQQAMDSTGGTLTVSLLPIQYSSSEHRPRQPFIELQISDTGAGMDAETLKKIFDPFFTTKEPGKGTGLGLSVIHGIVEMMQGQITVTSEIEGGTSFRLLFPVATAIEDVRMDSKPKTQIAGVEKTILLVDDEENIRHATQAVLTRKGYIVECATNGKFALDEFRSNPSKYDLIITDLSMPKMSGAELTMEIRKLNASVPIILSTGQLGIEDRKELRNIGITAFIQKPWTTGELIERIVDIQFPEN